MPLAEALVQLWAAAHCYADAFGHGQINEARPFPGRVAEGFCAAVGVLHCLAEAVGFDKATQCDVILITLKKSERLFSPTTRTNDGAISQWDFHWESQSLTREASVTGQRYIRHAERSSRVMLFVRVAAGFCAAVENKLGGVTLPIRWRCEGEIQAAQSTSCSLSTRLNSLTLWLTTVAPIARA
ncbi:DUF3427 domain-containing protein [Cyanobium sp. Morenito 9A2]|uniref:DUF3427 domain-containing protein n=1 Tax=Cyanobium sp. Morenito 9A2 TaxID=2823718 RepID=UPI0020CC40BA|nr:DUF3427 domain-containing protein [Cyanobium sp. Morenito 9A2]MCP9850824.1 DUF3427 domain-containing protein [Cyanobium sp. Morenito 9A2]